MPDERRGAQFVCAAALVLPGGRAHVSEGVVRGRLIREPRGQNGFGYDPIFVPDSAAITTAEMDPADKDRIPATEARRICGGLPGNRRVPWPNLEPDESRGREHEACPTCALAPGDAAPDFSLPDADGNEVSLSSLRGQRVIIYFYPAAMTPGAAPEAGVRLPGQPGEPRCGRVRGAGDLAGHPGEAGEVP